LLEKYFFNSFLMFVLSIGILYLVGVVIMGEWSHVTD
jgi:hypothetical protein